MFSSFARLLLLDVCLYGRHVPVTLVLIASAAPAVCRPEGPIGARYPVAGTCMADGPFLW